MKQPDFQRLFFDYFGKAPRRVTYTVRGDSNRHHDIIFLSSLIHDARFRISGVILRRQRLTIPLMRDCWELGFTRHRRSEELHVARSVLTVFPVSSIEWRLPHGQGLDGSELWIATVWLGRIVENELCDFVIAGDDWRCVVKVRDDRTAILLADQETPYLYSKRNPGTKRQ